MNYGSKFLLRWDVIMEIIFSFRPKKDVWLRPGREKNMHTEVHKYLINHHHITSLF